MVEWERRRLSELKLNLLMEEMYDENERPAGTTGGWNV